MATHQDSQLRDGRHSAAARRIGPRRRRCVPAAIGGEPFLPFTLCGVAIVFLAPPLFAQDAAPHDVLGPACLPYLAAALAAEHRFEEQVSACVEEIDARGLSLAKQFYDDSHGGTLPKPDDNGLQKALRFEMRPQLLAAALAAQVGHACEPFKDPAVLQDPHMPQVTAMMRKAFFRAACVLQLEVRSPGDHRVLGQHFKSLTGRAFTGDTVNDMALADSLESAIRRAIEDKPVLARLPPPARDEGPAATGPGPACTLYFDRWESVGTINRYAPDRIADCLVEMHSRRYLFGLALHEDLNESYSEGRDTNRGRAFSRALRPVVLEAALMLQFGRSCEQYFKYRSRRLTLDADYDVASEEDIGEQIGNMIEITRRVACSYEMDIWRLDQKERFNGYAQALIEARLVADVGDLFTVADGAYFDAAVRYAFGFDELPANRPQ